MRASAKIVPVLAVVGVLAAACSSSTGGTGGTASPSTSPSTTASSSSATTSSSASATTSPTGTLSSATLRSIVVQQSDLPSGYSGTTAAPETKDSNTEKQISDCVGRKDTSDQDQLLQVQSDDFKMGQVTVSSDATSYKSAADVANQVALIKAPKAQACLNSLFKKEIGKSLPSTAKIDKGTVTLDTSSSATPNLVGSVQGQITVSAQGQTITVYLAIELITGRQLTADISVTSIGAKISSSLTTSVVEAVAKRAASA